jgi:tape measure domain-containing protein
MRTVEEIHIRVTEDGSRVVSRNIENIGKSSSVAERSLGALKATIAGVVSGVVLNQLKELADSYTRIQNQLRLSTSGQENLNAVFDELVAISMRTRSSLEGNVELYSRLTMAAKALGASQQEVLQFTESVNKAIKISGASTSEASAGLRQLSQALASGVLRGDEFNSIMENLPAVADVVSKSLGVQRGELRAMAEEGKLTGDIILKAFREARAELDEKFAKTVPTISEGFVMLKNQLLVTVGAIDSASGASSALGGGFLVILEAMKEVTPELVNFSRALTGSLDPMDEMSSAGKVFATIFLTVYDVLRNLVKLVSTVVIGAFNAAGKNIGAFAAAASAVLRGDFAEAGNIIRDRFVEGVTGLVTGTSELYNDLVAGTSTTVEKIIKIWDKGAREVQDRSSLARGTISSESPGKASIVNEKELEKQRRAVERMQNQLRQLLSQISPVEAAQIQLAQDTRDLQEAFNAGIVSIEDHQRFIELLADSYRDALDPMGAFNREMEEQFALLAMGAEEREVEMQTLEVVRNLKKQGIITTEEETQAIRDQLTTLQQYSTLVAAQDQILANTVGKRRDFMTQLQAIQELIANPESGFGADDATRTSADMLASIGIDLEGTQIGIDAQLAAIREMYAQIYAMRDANLLSERQAQEAIGRVQMQQRDLQLKNAQGFFGNMSSLMNAGNEKLFKIGKAFAIAQATTSYFQAIMNAYATQPWYVGLAQGIFATVSLANTLSQLKNTKYQGGGGFMAGGYTGDGATNQVAGAVHGQEYVLNAATTRRLGVANLDRLQQGQATLARTGSGTRGSGALEMSVEIYNYGSDKEFTVERMDEQRVRVIAKDVARQEVYAEAPKAVASEMNNPNGVVSGAMSRNFSSQRKR